MNRFEPELNEREIIQSIKESRKYLSTLKLKTGEDEYNPNIADSDGLVTYINATTNTPPPEYVEERKKVSAILEGLTGIVTAAVLETSGNDSDAKHKPELWVDPVKYALSPFISGLASETKTYDREVAGIEVATQFLNILIDAVSEEGGALNSFKKFLAEQGETIKIQGSETKEGYKYACIGMVHELFQIEGEKWMYLPKIKLYFTSFTRETFEVTSSCVSVKHVKFNFKIEKFIAPFKIEYWRQNEWFKKEVDQFISDFTQADIAKSKNYLEGIFKSKKKLSDEKHPY